MVNNVKYVSGRYLHSIFFHFPHFMTHLIELSNLVSSLMSPLSLSLFLKVRSYTDNSYIIRSVKVCIKDWTLKKLKVLSPYV